MSGNSIPSIFFWFSQFNEETRSVYNVHKLKDMPTDDKQQLNKTKVEHRVCNLLLLFVTV